MFQEFRILKGVLKGLFKTKSSGKESVSSIITSVRYLNGHEVLDRDPERFRRALLTQGISKDQLKYGKYLQWTNELRIADNRVVEVVEHSYDQDSFSQLVDFELPIQDWPDHQYYFLIPNKDGVHQVGGRPAQEVNFQSPFGFSFIASISGKDPLFEWLRIDRLDIYYPINTCSEGIFIDYSEIGNPVILNPEVLSDSWDTENADSSLIGVFSEVRYESVEDISEDLLLDEFGDTLICGVPMWYQALDIPVCPKTGEVMKYVATIRSNTKNQLVQGKSIFGDYLIFMDMGFLYVFWEPTSKVMYLVAQS